ncbi:MAG TPA: hypothetical protein VFZ44_19230 [Pyrinomonadaceae bacterium]
MIRYATFLMAVALCSSGAARVEGSGRAETTAGVVAAKRPRPSERLSAPGVPLMQQATDVVRILNDRTLWGKDFPTALAFIESMGRAGERRVYVFPDRVVGAARYRTQEEAQRAAARLAEAMRTPRRRARPAYDVLLQGVPLQSPTTLRVEVVRLEPDDENFHVAWVGTSLQFMPRQLTVAAVTERLGPPERTVQELIQNDTERRPVVLTLYFYGGGAVAFAESDWAPVPGYVDRAVLDVPAVTAALF